MSNNQTGELSSIEPSIKASDVEKSQAYHGEATEVEDLEEREKGRGFVRDPSDVNSHHKSGLEASLVRKADAVILPFAALVFLVAYMDRNNVGNARTIGMQLDLGLTSNEFFNILMMFYVGYCILMLPGMLCLRVIGPHRQLGGATIIFGVLVCCIAASKSYGTILALRVLIGMFQSLNQGISIYTSLWYKRDEVATRGAIFYAFATISGAFSGLIAYGAEKNLHGNDGKLGWQWLFIVEGVASIGIGILVWLIFPAFPDQIKEGKKHWLFTEEELNLAVSRTSSYNTPGAKVQGKQILITLMNPKSWCFIICSGIIGMCTASIGNFLPTFIAAFGYSPLRTQLYSAIPYGCATVTLVAVNMISDRVNKKGPFLVGCLAVVCVGYVILIAVESVQVKIFATCLVASGVYPSVILLVAWLGINTGGYTKRATTWAGCEILAQCLSIAGTHIYTDPPRYVKGHSIMLAMMVISISAACTNIYAFNRANKRKDQIEKEYLERGEVHPHRGKTLEDVQDDHISFRYIL